ncbi:transporter [Sphingomonas sp. 1P06PA]|uniref:transporter n=1 Tax=Sphingomonas sp. 1P06PA TaxID=554121 RepID=UPI0039A5CCCB
MSLLIALALAAAARDYCPERPGLGTPACTIEAGHLSVETSVADWTIDRGADTVLIGDTLLRLGLSNRLEAQLGWTPLGFSGGRSGVGDVTLALKANLRNPDGSGFSAALLPFVTAPAGGGAIGAGDWAAGLVVPVGVDLGHGLSLQLTGEVDAAVDQDRHGRHAAVGGVIGLGAELSDAVATAIEIGATRDDDPAGTTTETLASLSLGWLVSDDFQLDAGVAAGLNHDSPDLQLSIGVSRRF